jgi:protein translocase SEC61 complex gamma subunit
VISFLPSFKSFTRLLKLARKPGKDEIWLTIKVCSVGIVAIGFIGFIVKILSALLASSFPG